MLKVEKIKQDKERYLPLLQLADDNEERIQEYLERYDLYILFSGATAVSQAVVEQADSICNIISIATDPKHRNMGYAERLVNYLKDDYENTAQYISIKVPKKSVPAFHALGFISARMEGEFVLMKKDLKENY